jgi:hypothetical protein
MSAKLEFLFVEFDAQPDEHRRNGVHPVVDTVGEKAGGMEERTKAALDCGENYMNNDSGD